MHSAATSSPAQTVPQLSPLLVRLRELSIGLLLFGYLWLGPARAFPPIVPFVPLALLAGLSGWWIWKLWRKEGLARSPLTMPMVAFLAATVLATAFSIDQRMSLDGALATLAEILTFFVVCDLLQAGWSAATFVNGLLLAVTLLLAQGLFEVGSWFWAWYAFRVPEYPIFLLPFRLFGVADHPNLLAGLVNLALPFAIVRLGLARSRLARLGYGLWLLVAEIVSFFAHSRTGWAASLVVIGITVGWLLLHRIRSTGSRLTLRTLGQQIIVTRRIWLTTFGYLIIFSMLIVFNNQVTTSSFSSNAGVEHRLGAFSRAWSVFLDHPITGSGPLTFGRIYVDEAVASRVWIDPHPHNIIFDILAQQGAIGILTFAWVLIAGVLTIAGGWQRYFQSKPIQTTDHGIESDQQMLLVAVSAGLASYLAHGQFDVPTRLPVTALMIMVLCALGMYATDRLKPGVRQGRWGSLALLAPIGIAVVVLRQGAGQDALLDGIVKGLRNDWRGAATALDQAREADPDFAFYTSQQAFAYGMLADPLRGSSDPDALRQALAAYAEAQQQEPAYAPNLLNYASLLQADGQQQPAHDTLNAAFAHGQDWPIAALLLGEQASKTGDDAKAQKLFAIAFESDPFARDMAACQQSNPCRTAADRIATENSIRQIHMQIQGLLRANRPEQALAVLRLIPITDAAPLPWIDRAAAHLALGQLPQARYALATANVLGNTSSAEPALMASNQAALHIKEDQPEAAIADLEHVARPQIDEEVYDYSVFWRLGLPGQLLPALDRLQRTADDLAVYRQLVDLYAAAERTSDAAWAKAQGDALAQLLEEK